MDGAGLAIRVGSAILSKFGIDKTYILQYNLIAIKNNYIVEGNIMYVRKKYMVQKSFRLDEQVEKDMSVLAQLTNRSQNELVNCAISEFLKDNKNHFLTVAILEHFEWQINNGSTSMDDFEMGGLTVRMRYIEDDKVEVYSFNTIEGKLVNENTSVFESDICKKLDEWLKNLSLYIERDSEDVKKYLDGRTDYADYVRVRK